MWILNYVTKKSIGESPAEKGNIAASSDGRVHVNASSEFSEIPIVAPYGISYSPPSGEGTVVINANGSDVCLGTVAKGANLEVGELMLSSLGGASIVLKNDGGVYINGVRY
jgi:hypothetical protein